jgi:hypothetical protein
LNWDDFGIVCGLCVFVYVCDVAQLSVVHR